MGSKLSSNYILPRGTMKIPVSSLNLSHIARVANLNTALNSKLSTAALATGLATKADLTHAHVVADITDANLG